MKLEDQVCSLPLAKRLKDLGVKQGKSLFAWSYWMDHAAGSDARDCHKKHWEVTTQDGGNMGERYDAFTVAELGEMLPPKIFAHEDERYLVMNHAGEWEVSYKGSITGEKRVCVWAEKEADARAKMLIHILEKGLVRP